MRDVYGQSLRRHLRAVRRVEGRGGFRSGGHYELGLRALRASIGAIRGVWSDPRIRP